MSIQTVTPQEWMEARLQLLTKEKEHTHARDELSRLRRELPRVRVDRDYRFESADGPRSLLELFDHRSQLIIYHFMYAPDWDEGCEQCSFWTDSYSGTAIHLAARDVTLVLVSRAQLPKLSAYQRRMRWADLTWVSSHGSQFNFDYGVSFTADQRRDGAFYNYAHVDHPKEEIHGLSVFTTDAAGAIYHTYSTYGRGIDSLNTAYQLLDLTPKGRDEGNAGPSWVRRHDKYDTAR